VYDTTTATGRVGLWPSICGRGAHARRREPTTSTGDRDE